MKLYFKSTKYWSRIEYPDDIFVRKITPTKLTFSCFAWHVLSWFGRGRFVEYQIVKKYSGEIVSYACVSPRIYTLPFIPKGGYHIGPCATVQNQRGNGYYPMLLQYILEEHPEREYYMVIDEGNIASINGVKKIGFEVFARGLKKNHRYVKIPF